MFIIVDSTVGPVRVSGPMCLFRPFSNYVYLYIYTPFTLKVHSTVYQDSVIIILHIDDDL